MFKKSDLLPLILAFLSTVLIVTLGFAWLSNEKIAGFGENNLRQTKIATATKAKANSVTNSSVAPNGDRRKFVLPAIVPQGTSVIINGSSKLNRINQALRRSFHRQYPGTIITTNADGNDISLDLLYARDIDLVALDRPLNESEKAAGLQAIPLNRVMTEKDAGSDMSDMYYVYLEPLSPDTEAFLGYALSVKGRQAILNR